MYKLLIIDDEYLVRLGLEETIDWGQFNVQIVGSAKNGKEGLQLAETLLPDIIISDVRMPLMDGLELTKVVNEKNLDTIVIILSGYKDFEYAKETLENGAFQYLLKPIDNDQLIEVVKKAINALERRRSQEQRLQDIEKEVPLIKTTVIQNLISGNYANISEIVTKIDSYKLMVPNSGYVVYGEIDQQEKLEKQHIKLANHDLFQILMSSLTKAEINFASVIYFSHFVFLVDIEMDKLLRILEEALNKYEETHDEISSIGISNKFDCFEKIYENYLEAKRNAKNKLLLTINTITSFKDSHLGFRKIIVDVIRFISKHYHENISIETVSKRFDISQSHLMHTFKEDVGKTFNECLAEYRIRIAKKLLLQRKYRIYEVGEKVGYPDTKYFSQVFRKFENMSPAEYIAKYQN